MKKILTPTDFSETSKIALNCAAYLTSRLDANLEVFHVLKPFELGEDHTEEQKVLLAQLHHHQREHVRHKMSKLASSANIVRKDIQFHFAKGLSIGDEIVAEGEKKNIDLIVMGKHNDSSFRRLFLGSVTEYVVQYASCAVLVTGRSSSAPIQQFSKILLATDFSTPSFEAARTAMSLAKMENASVQILHVIDDVHSNVPRTDKQLAGRMAEFAVKHQKLGIPVSTRIERGKPSRLIAEVAEQNDFDLVVVGTSGIRGLDRFILGSVSSRVLRYSNVPVLVARPKLQAAHS